MRIFILIVSTYFLAICSAMALLPEKNNAVTYQVTGQEFYSQELDTKQLEELNHSLHTLAEALNPALSFPKKKYTCLLSGRASLYLIELQKDTVLAMQTGDLLVPLVNNNQDTYKAVMLHYLENFEETVYQLAHCSYDQTELVDILTHYNELIRDKEADTPPVYR